MTPDEMLAILTEYGDDALSDFNDEADVMGYFGWSISGDLTTLRITYTSSTEDVHASASWRLVPVAPSVSEPAGETT
jgi:hypothetical protein